MLAVVEQSDRIKAAHAKAFLKASGLVFHDVEVRILDLAENAAVVADSEGMHRVVLWRQMSYASETIARQNQGHIVVLKIKGWQ